MLSSQLTKRAYYLAEMSRLVISSNVLGRDDEEAVAIFRMLSVLQAGTSFLLYNFLFSLRKSTPEALSFFCFRVTEMCSFRVFPIFRGECFDVDESPLFSAFSIRGRDRRELLL